MDGIPFDGFLSGPWSLAVAIFVARILDVSLGTLRTIVVFRGYRVVAAVVGFFEVIVWLGAAGQVFQNLDAWYLAIAYAGGFAAGNVVGIWLDSKLAMGSELVRVVSESPEIGLASRLRQHGYSVTELPGRGDNKKPVEVLYVVDKRRRVPKLLRLIGELDPSAFWTISDIKRRADDTRPLRRAVWPVPEWLRIVKRK